MKATKLFLVVAGLLLAGLVGAQTSGTQTGTAATSASSATTDSSSTADNNLAALVLAIGNDDDLTEVAEAIDIVGTDDLIASMDEGITIFAPVDGSFDQDVVIEDVIASYIVPGIIDAADMVDDTTATSMSGEPVSIAVIEDEITVNGIPLVDEVGIYSGNVVIYKLTDSFAGDGLASVK